MAWWHLQEIDLTVAPLVLTQARSQVVDSTVPYFYQTTHVAVLKASSAGLGQWAVFLRPFLWQVGGLLFATPPRGSSGKASASRAGDAGFSSFSLVDTERSVKNNNKTWYSGCYPASAWRHRASTETGWPGVSILWLAWLRSWLRPGVRWWRRLSSTLPA